MMVLAGNREHKVFYIGEIYILYLWGPPGKELAFLDVKYTYLIQVGKYKLKALVTKNIS